MYSVSQKIPPEDLWQFFFKTVRNFSTKFYVPIMRSYLRSTADFYSINQL